jgi:membrane-bound metal-dependent hydrolase YbcI (DUF457 family)
MLLLGSLAFGLEAMFVGFGGKLLLIYRRHRGATLGAAFLLGFLIVVLAIVTSTFLNLEPVFLMLVVLVYSLILGKVIGVFRAKLFGRTPPPAPWLETSEEEIKRMISARGFDNLLEKNERRRRSEKGGVD